MVVEIQDGSVGMNRDPAEIIAAEMGPGTLRRLKEHMFMDANKGACVKASAELHGALARYTWAEVLTIVKSVPGLAEVQVWSTFHANYSRRT